jgi:hypothetical protein
LYIIGIYTILAPGFGIYLQHYLDHTWHSKSNAHKQPSTQILSIMSSNFQIFEENHNTNDSLTSAEETTSTEDSTKTVRDTNNTNEPSQSDQSITDPAKSVRELLVSEY